jgi:energy-coupling factor transporter transmembrane protein EcfT
MTLHPTTRILAFILLAIIVQRLTLVHLSILASVLAMLLVAVKASIFIQMLRRMRWLLLTMLLIYAFSTPGEYIAEWPYWVAPTLEGIDAGLIQALRLLAMLAGLALLLTLTDRDRLIVGFFVLLAPLRRLGLDPERFAARLWLTLHYVEKPQDKKTPAAMFEQLRDFHIVDTDEQPMTIQLTTYVFGWLDYALLFIVLVFGVAFL